SSKVVLPLWKGPTSAMHRGPAALVPFCAMYPPPLFTEAFLEPSGPGNHRFKPKGGLARGSRFAHALAAMLSSPAGKRSQLSGTQGAPMEILRCERGRQPLLFLCFCLGSPGPSLSG